MLSTVKAEFRLRQWIISLNVKLMNFHFYLQNKVTQRTGNKATEFHNNLEFTDNHRGVVSLETTHITLLELRTQIFSLL